MKTLPEIQQEYAQLASHAGQLQYQVKIHESELRGINARMKKLNEDASKINEFEANQVKKEADKKAAAEKKEAEEKAKAEKEKLAIVPDEKEHAPVTGPVTAAAEEALKNV